MARENLSVVLAKRPTAAIEAGTTFRVETSPMPVAADLPEGHLLVEALYLSIDAAMRGWLNDRPSYLPPVQVGEVMRGSVAARVLASRSAKAQAGDIVVAQAGWTEVAVLPEARVENPLAALPAALRERVRPIDLVNLLGISGLTAYFGLTRAAGGIRPTDTVVVSGAAGATGSAVGQLARLMGARRIVGITGSAAKARWLVDDLGCFDVALNYRDADFAAQLAAATATDDDRIDVFWDNVGGDILDLALPRAARGARFVLCGGISQYNEAVPRGPRNLLQVIVYRIRLQGFVVLDYAADFAEAYGVLIPWIADGRLKSREYIVRGGLREAEGALIGLYQGVNTGKLLVEIKNPDEPSYKL